jgi:hypothetical protein
MEQKTIRIARIALGAFLLVAVGYRPSSATNCGTMADVGTAGLFPIYKAITGNDPCPVVTGTGPPAQASMTCTAPQLSGLPQFLKTPPGTAVYPFSGTCTSPDKPEAHLSYRIEGKWTPTADTNREPNASEIITITDYELVFPGRAPGGQVYVLHTAKCVQDPWITTNRNCSIYGSFIPEDVRTSWSDINTIMQSFPWTANVIPPSDKKRLLAEYNKVNGIVTPLAATPSQARVGLVGYPTLVSPTKGQRFFAQSPILIKVAPPWGWNATTYWISFQKQAANGAWITQDQNRAPITKPNPLALPAAQVQSDGYAGFTTALTGTWRLNAQVSAPKVSTPSDWVEFSVVTPPPASSYGVQRKFTK